MAGVETLVSTQLDPGVDPILEADRRGSILAILRVDGKFLVEPDNDRPAPVPLGLPLLHRPSRVMGLPDPPHVPLGAPEKALPPAGPASRPLHEPAEDETGEHYFNGTF